MHIKCVGENLGQGFITTVILKEILSDIDDSLSDEELDGIIKEVDTDGSGTMDFDGNFIYNKYKTCIFPIFPRLKIIF